MLRSPFLTVAASLALVFSMQMIATPSSATSEPIDTVPTLMYVQNYLDFSDEALASGTLPEIVMITIMQMDSVPSAEFAYGTFIQDMNLESESMVTEIDDIGDEALFVESVDDGGDHGAWMIARSGDTLILSFVTGAPDALEIAPEIIEFMIENGPSEEDAIVEANGEVTGGWADAFPQPEDIAGLAHLEPAPVMDFSVIDSSVPPATPDIQPVKSTPAA